MKNKFAIIAVLAFFALFGCTGILGGNSSDSSSAYSGTGVAPARAGELSAPYAPAPSGTQGIGTDGKVVIKSGSAEIEVAQGTLDEKLAQLKNIIFAQKGDVDSVSYYESDYSKEYYVTVKIPPSAFESLAETLKPLGKLKSMSTSTDDVTLEWTDLETRISNLKAEEGRLLELYNKSGNVKEVLAVESELTRVQTELEYQTAAKMRMEGQVRMSTVMITIKEQAPVVQGSLFVQLGDIVSAFIGSLGAGLILLAGFAGIAIPLGIMLIIVLFAARKFWEYWKSSRPAVQPAKGKK